MVGRMSAGTAATEGWIGAEESTSEMTQMDVGNSSPYGPLHMAIDRI